MSADHPYSYGFGTAWQDVYVTTREGYSTSVTDYHEHDFYEINLILSGNIRILLGDRSRETTETCMVLTRPRTPHYIACHPDTLYRRLYLVFTDDFVADHIAQWQQLAALFGETGRILSLDAEQTARFRDLILQIDRETAPFRRRLLIYYLLSHVSELSGAHDPESTRLPPYILEALAYLEEHHAEEIVATDLAQKLHVGRTTLMTEFKRHTGQTLGQYLTHCRLRHAVRLLREGKTIEYAAARCGFADGSGLSHSFKRHYGTTLKAYVRQKQ